MANKIDSNRTGLYIAEEQSLKVLPVTPVWREKQPNSYPDFGSELTNTARNPINASRQMKKGVLVDIDASGGFNADYTQEDIIEDMQGFLYADAREKISTIPLNGTAIPLTNITTSAFEAASGLDSFKAGDLVFASGMNDAINNGFTKVTAVLATSLTVNKTLTADASPASTAKIEQCGFEFPTGDLDITVTGSTSIELSTTVTDLTTLGLNVGEWIGIGGDAAINQFVNNDAGFGRIASIAANSIELDDTTFTPVTEVAAAQEVQIFFGPVIRNEDDPSLIKRRSYQLERSLDEDTNGTQAQYLIGAIPSELTINYPLSEKVNIDFSYTAMDEELRNGTQGLKSGTRISSPDGDAFNTTSNINRIKLSEVDPINLNPTALIGFLDEASISINNNVSPSKAIGVLGAFDANTGQFEVSGSVTGYFTEVAVLSSIRGNIDAGLSIISSSKNKGYVFDIPLMALSTTGLTVEQNESVKIPVESSAAENKNGYTFLTCYFPYLSDALEDSGKN